MGALPNVDVLDQKNTVAVPPVKEKVRKKAESLIAPPQQEGDNSFQDVLHEVRKNKATYDNTESKHRADILAGHDRTLQDIAKTQIDIYTQIATLESQRGRADQIHQQIEQLTAERDALGRGDSGRVTRLLSKLPFTQRISRLQEIRETEEARNLLDRRIRDLYIEETNTTSDTTLDTHKRKAQAQLLEIEDKQKKSEAGSSEARKKPNYHEEAYSKEKSNVETAADKKMAEIMAEEGKQLKEAFTSDPQFAEAYHELTQNAGGDQELIDDVVGKAALISAQINTANIAEELDSLFTGEIGGSLHTYISTKALDNLLAPVSHQGKALGPDEVRTRPHLVLDLVKKACATGEVDQQFLDRYIVQYASNIASTSQIIGGLQHEGHERIGLITQLVTDQGARDRIAKTVGDAFAREIVKHKKYIHTGDYLAVKDAWTALGPELQKMVAINPDADPIVTGIYIQSVLAKTDQALPLLLNEKSSITLDSEGRLHVTKDFIDGLIGDGNVYRAHQLLDAAANDDQFILEQSIMDDKLFYDFIGTLGARTCDTDFAAFISEHKDELHYVKTQNRTAVAFKRTLLDHIDDPQILALLNDTARYAPVAADDRTHLHPDIVVDEGFTPDERSALIFLRSMQNSHNNTHGMQLTTEPVRILLHEAQASGGHVRWDTLKKLSQYGPEGRETRMMHSMVGKLLDEKSSLRIAPEDIQRIIDEGDNADRAILSQAVLGLYLPDAQYADFENNIQNLVTLEQSEVSPHGFQITVHGGISDRILSPTTLDHNTVDYELGNLGNLAESGAIRTDSPPLATFFAYRKHLRDSGAAALEVDTRSQNRGTMMGELSSASLFRTMDAVMTPDGRFTADFFTTVNSELGNDQAVALFQLLSSADRIDESTLPEGYRNLVALGKIPEARPLVSHFLFSLKPEAPEHASLSAKKPRNPIIFQPDGTIVVDVDASFNGYFDALYSTWKYQDVLERSGVPVRLEYGDNKDVLEATFKLGSVIDKMYDAKNSRRTYRQNFSQLRKAVETGLITVTEKEGTLDIQGSEENFRKLFFHNTDVAFALLEKEGLEEAGATVNVAIPSFFKEGLHLKPGNYAALVEASPYRLRPGETTDSLVDHFIIEDGKMRLKTSFIKKQLAVDRFGALSDDTNVVRRAFFAAGLTDFELEDESLRPLLQLGVRIQKGLPEGDVTTRSFSVELGLRLADMKRLEPVRAYLHTETDEAGFTTLHIKEGMLEKVFTNEDQAFDYPDQKFWIKTVLGAVNGDLNEKGIRVVYDAKDAGLQKLARVFRSSANDPSGYLYETFFNDKNIKSFPDIYAKVDEYFNFDGDIPQAKNSLIKNLMEAHHTAFPSAVKEFEGKGLLDFGNRELFTRQEQEFYTFLSSSRTYQVASRYTFGKQDIDFEFFNKDFNVVLQVADGVPQLQYTLTKEGFEHLGRHTIVDYFKAGVIDIESMGLHPAELSYWQDNVDDYHFHEKLRLYRESGVFDHFKLIANEDGSTSVFPPVKEFLSLFHGVALSDLDSLKKLLGDPQLEELWTLGKKIKQKTPFYTEKGETAMVVLRDLLNQPEEARDEFFRELDAVAAACPGYEYRPTHTRHSPYALLNTYYLEKSTFSPDSLRTIAGKILESTDSGFEDRETLKHISLAFPEPDFIPLLVMKTKGFSEEQTAELSSILQGEQFTDEKSKDALFEFFFMAAPKIGIDQKDAFTHVVRYANQLILDKTLQPFVIDNVEKLANIPAEKLPSYLEVISTITNSPSQEIQRLKSQLLEQIVATDDPLLTYQQVEKVFVQNNLPTVGKVYRVFEILYPATRIASMVNGRTSPVLQKASARRRQHTIYGDLLKTHVESGNTSMRDFIGALQTGEQLLAKAEQGVELSPSESAKLTIFFKKMDTLYNTSQNGRRNSKLMAQGRYPAGEDFTVGEQVDLLKQQLGVREDQTILERVGEMFLWPAGYDSLDEVLSTMESSRRAAHARNLAEVAQAHEGFLTLAAGDLFKGIDVTHLGNIMQNGSVSKEYLGGVLDSDSTPFDTDVSRILDEDANGGFEHAFNNSISKNYGELVFLVRNRGQFVETNQNSTPQHVPEKLELFVTGGERHYGIRTGFPSTEIDMMIAQDALLSNQRGLEDVYYTIAESGFYVPVVDTKGKIIFTPGMYEEYRRIFAGIEVFKGEEIHIEPTRPRDAHYHSIQELIPLIKDDMVRVVGLADQVRATIEETLRSNGVILKDEYDTSILHAELYNTGSSGRGTNLPGDYDFDLSLSLDAKDFPKAGEISSQLIAKLRPDEDKSHPEAEYIQVRAIGAKGIRDDPLDVDIGISRKSDLRLFASHDAVRAKLAWVKENLGEDQYYNVIANIVLAKKILKEGSAYKKGDSTMGGHGGFGGIGTETWILQHGGNMVSAFKSFHNAAYDKGHRVPLEEFRQRYRILDPGINIKHRRHDNFAYVLSEAGYSSMIATIANYLDLPVESVPVEEEVAMVS